MGYDLYAIFEQTGLKSNCKGERNDTWNDYLDFEIRGTKIFNKFAIPFAMVRNSVVKLSVVKTSVPNRTSYEPAVQSSMDSEVRT